MMSSKLQGLNEIKPKTVFPLCVLKRDTEILHPLVDVGASFSNDRSIVLLAMRNLYRDDEGSTTTKLLTVLSKCGAEPQTPGFMFTLLQLEVHHLEERWVHSVPMEYADPNVMGSRRGEHPGKTNADAEKWYVQHLLHIYRTTDRAGPKTRTQKG
jgi:hypothetical protein